MVRQQSNTEYSQFVTDPEIVNYLDRAYRELYDILTTEYEAYNVAPAYKFATTAGVDTYALPENFYKLLGVDLNIDANRSLTLRPFMVSERNRFQSGLFSPILPGAIYQYHLWGGNIRLIPLPSAQGASITLWYVPIPLKLVLTVTDILTQISAVDVINGYDNFIELYAVIKVLAKMERDTSAWERMLADMRQDILDTAANRDAGNPERVTDAATTNWFLQNGSPYGMGY